jgi:excisionase family DNA binding protein
MRRGDEVHDADQNDLNCVPLILCRILHPVGVRHEAAAPLLTNEVAKILNVSPETVRLWERAGRLRAVRTAGGVRLFDRRDVERLSRERDSKESA